MKLTDAQKQVLSIVAKDACVAFPLRRWPETVIGPLMMAGYIRLSDDKKRWLLTGEGEDALLDASYATSRSNEVG